MTNSQDPSLRHHDISRRRTLGDDLVFVAGDYPDVQIVNHVTWSVTGVIPTPFRSYSLGLFEHESSEFPLLGVGSSASAPATDGGELNDLGVQIALYRLDSLLGLDCRNRRDGKQGHEFEMVATLRKHSAGILDLCSILGEGDSFLVSGSLDTSVRVWSLSDFEEVFSYVFASAVMSVCFAGSSSSGRPFCGLEDGFCYTLDVEKNLVVGGLSHPHSVLDLVYGGSELPFVVCCFYEGFRMIDLCGERAVKEFGEEEKAMTICQHPEKPHLIFAGGRQGIVTLWDVRMEQEPVSERRIHSERSTVRGIAPIGQGLFASCASGSDSHIHKWTEGFILKDRDRERIVQTSTWNYDLVATCERPFRKNSESPSFRKNDHKLPVI